MGESEGMLKKYSVMKDIPVVIIQIVNQVYIVLTAFVKKLPVMKVRHVMMILIVMGILHVRIILV